MNKFDYITYDVKVTTLSPLHIGTGHELMQNYDYAIHNGRTWRLDEVAFHEAQNVEDPSVMRQLMTLPPAQLLRPEDFEDKEGRSFRYVIRGTPRSQQAGSILREQIKTVDDEPYLPGSSLKGALRTALAWKGWEEKKLKPDRTKIDERRPKFAARDYEHALFGNDPNHDLFRALLIGDSTSSPADRLMLINVRVMTSKGIGKDIPVEVEAIRPETVFNLPMKIDTRLFSEWAHQRKDFKLGGNPDWLLKMTGTLREHALVRIQRQLSWFRNRESVSLVSDFYSRLEKLSFSENQFIVHLGWGGGWDSKTLGSRLQDDSKFFDWLVVQPKLGMLRGKALANRKPGSPFPSTRRVAMKRGADKEETVAAPLGWVLVELTEK
ncbi:MAG TPA: type III-A CRISPR-associated RAMP protein Csm5 [Anaerolineales bacterium]|nr:type III-A CRISPR-associated RAMP protein Csm5 [Anaerolineales bacterium]